MAIRLITRWRSRNHKLSIFFVFVSSSFLFCIASIVILWYTFKDDVVSRLTEKHLVGTESSNDNPSVSEKSHKFFSAALLNENNRGILSNHGESIYVKNKLFSKINTQLKYFCPPISPLLVGWLDISVMLSGLLQDDLAPTELKVGGRYEPKNCQSRDKVAIVVPYRKRLEHLRIFLQYMHPFLQRQQLAYTVFVVEQFDGMPFNRGMLMNIGYKEATKLDSFQCFIFHDVDLLPEDDRNIYTCPKKGKPRQMAFSMDIYDYKLAPNTYFGGVNTFLSSDFQLVNGYSNLFWGWGSEDDDLYHRLLRNNLTVVRLFSTESSLVNIVRYKMLDHDWVNPNPDREWLFEEGSHREKYDGLNNLNYVLIKEKLTPLYTHILVELKKNEEIETMPRG